MAWLYAAVLVVWGNLASALLGPSARLPGGSWAFVMSGAALIGVSLLFARATGLDRGALGLASAGVRGAAMAAAAAAVVALVAVALLRWVVPAIVGVELDYVPLARVTPIELGLHVMFFLPLGAVVPEELAFRGVLLGALTRGPGMRTGVAVSAAAFALWHAAVVVVTIGETTLGPASSWSVAAVIGGLIVVFGGGVVFALVRLRLGTLASAIAAHWAFNALVLLGLRYATPVPQLAP